MPTNIDWCDEVWNPTTGCTKGCPYCYARAFAERMAKNPNAKIAHKYRNGFAPTCHPESLSIPGKWKKPRRVFVDSMGDLFDPAIPESFIWAVFATMATIRQHTYLVLTKNPARMSSIIHGWQNIGLTMREGHGAVLPNVWLGVSITNQSEADALIPILRQIPAALRFASIEPMRGPVNFKREWLEGPDDSDVFRAHNLHGINWVICGLMSGSRKEIESCSYEEVADLRDQCELTEVPFYFKGWGSFRPGAQLDGREYRESPA